MVARNGSAENPEHCCYVEPSSIKEETKRKVTSRKMEAQRRLELVRSWYELVLLYLSQCGGFNHLCLFLLYGPQRALHYRLHCCLCSRAKKIIHGQPVRGLWSTASRRYMSQGPFWAPQASWSAKTPQQDTQEIEA